MNVNLLRSKMALMGDFDWTPLMELLDLSRPAIMARVNEETDWKLPEIRKIVRKYRLSEQDVSDIFDIGGHDENR